MGRPDDDRRSVTDPIPQHSRMDEEAQTRRTEAFARATQRKGMPMVYGSGKPGEGAEAVAKVRKREAAEAKREAAES